MIDAPIQTPPLKRSSPPIPIAPKRARKVSNIPIDEEYENILKQKIFTTHPDLYNVKDFNEEIEDAKMMIEDKTEKGKSYIEVNKKLSNDFTYKDLKDEILQAYLENLIADSPAKHISKELINDRYALLSLIHISEPTRPY